MRLHETLLAISIKCIKKIVYRTSRYNNIIFDTLTRVYAGVC